MNLFPSLRPIAPPPGIDLRCCGVDELIAWCKEKGVVSRLIMSDPPWLYANEPGVANPETNGIYSGLKMSAIVAHLDAAYDVADPAGSRLASWYTWPTEEEWRDAGQAGKRWGKRVTGGAWTKLQMEGDVATLRGKHLLGVGYHWRGQTEPIALFTRGATGRAEDTLLNGYVGAPTGHSEKPIPWLRDMVRAWTKPGDVVIDLYAGKAALARACAAEGRRYLGAEIDPDRHAQALTALARYLEAM
tara:strand:+ start:1869 stop:2603 length:735 start_codon:yes stop_codon:yes gene_type:complete